MFLVLTGSKQPPPLQVRFGQGDTEYVHTLSAIHREDFKSVARQPLTFYDIVIDITENTFTPSSGSQCHFSAFPLGTLPRDVRSFCITTTPMTPQKEIK